MTDNCGRLRSKLASRTRRSVIKGKGGKGKDGKSKDDKGKNGKEKAKVKNDKDKAETRSNLQKDM